MFRSLALFLMFGAITFLAYQFIPLFLKRYVQIQKKQVDKVGRQLDHMFIFKEERRRLLSIFTLIPLGLALLGLILSRSPLGLGVGLVLGLILPRIIIKNIASQRKNKFRVQLVDGLNVVSSSLKAGLSLNQAFDVLVQEMPSPIKDEFALVVRENQMGVVLEDCLLHLKQRMPVEDLDLIITAIKISRETGGNLTDILGQLVFTIREKTKLEGRVKALTVQGRLQGLIMGILPFFFGVFVYYFSPQNFRILLEDKLGRTLLIWCVISEIMGVIMIRKLSRIEV